MTLNEKTQSWESLAALARKSSYKNKINFLISQGNGIHRWNGVTYEVDGSRYRQVYAAGYPASNWKKLRNK